MGIVTLPTSAGALGGAERGALMLPGGAGRGALVCAPERPGQPCSLAQIAVLLKNSAVESAWIRVSLGTGTLRNLEHPG